VLFSLPRTSPAPSPCDAPDLPIAAASDGRGAVPVPAITDDNKLTSWTLGRPQQVGDWLRLDLGHAAAPCAVVMRQDGFQAFYPRTLSILTSVDGTAWTTTFSDKTGGVAIRGALASPARPQLAITLPASPARFIKLQVEQALSTEWWVVTDISVRGRPSGNLSQAP
jgi:hypothetical protein